MTGSTSDYVLLAQLLFVAEQDRTVLLEDRSFLKAVQAQPKKKDRSKLRLPESPVGYCVPGISHFPPEFTFILLRGKDVGNLFLKTQEEFSLAGGQAVGWRYLREATC